MNLIKQSKENRFLLNKLIRLIEDSEFENDEFLEEEDLDEDYGPDHLEVDEEDEGN